MVLQNCLFYTNSYLPLTSAHFLSSYDGVPFLMHDRTLRRTTNVREVFPNRTDMMAAMFTWAELEMLDAGSWFLHVREPFDLIL